MLRIDYDSSGYSVTNDVVYQRTMKRVISALIVARSRKNTAIIDLLMTFLRVKYFSGDKALISNPLCRDLLYYILIGDLEGVRQQLARSTIDNSTFRSIRQFTEKTYTILHGKESNYTPQNRLIILELEKKLRKNSRFSTNDRRFIAAIIFLIPIIAVLGVVVAVPASLYIFNSIFIPWVKYIAHISIVGGPIVAMPVLASALLHIFPLVAAVTVLFSPVAAIVSCVDLIKDRSAEALKIANIITLQNKFGEGEVFKNVAKENVMSLEQIFSSGNYTAEEVNAALIFAKYIGANDEVIAVCNKIINAEITKSVDMEGQNLTSAIAEEIKEEELPAASITLDQTNRQNWSGWPSEARSTLSKIEDACPGFINKIENHFAQRFNIIHENSQAISSVLGEEDSTDVQLLMLEYNFIKKIC